MEGIDWLANPDFDDFLLDPDLDAPLLDPLWDNPDLDDELVDPPDILDRFVEVRQMTIDNAAKRACDPISVSDPSIY